MVSSCEPGAPIMLQAGGPCAGFGTCVNSTLTPGRVLCKCNAGYSGASDFFDSRVEQLPDGSYLSLTCAESTIGTYVMWVFVALLGLIRLKQLIPVHMKFYRKYQAEKAKGTHPGFWKDFGLKVTTFDLYIVTFIYWLLAIAKLCGLTLGTDVLPTLVLPIEVFLFNIVQYEITGREFSIFIKGTMNSQEAKKAERFRTILKTSTLWIYSLIAAVSAWWTLSLDKTQGPVENYEYFVIVIRNGGVCIWGMLEIITTQMVRKQIVTTIKLSSSGDGDGSDSTGNSKSRVAATIANDNMQRPKSSTPNAVAIKRRLELNARTLEVVKKMEIEVRSLMVFLFSAGLTYGTFLIPFLYPFQTYCIAFVVAMGGMRHSGKSFQIEGNKTSESGGLGRQSSREDANRTPRGGAMVAAVTSHEATSKESSKIEREDLSTNVN